MFDESRTAVPCRWRHRTIHARNKRLRRQEGIVCCENVWRLTGHRRIARRCVNTLFREAGRYVALRAIGLTGASALRLLRLEGHRRIARRCVNMLFSKTLRDVALRAIGSILFGTQFAHHKRQKTIAIGTFFALGEWRFRMTATFA